MSERRVRVLDIAAEGGGVEIDAELDAEARPVAFYVWTGGAHGFEELFGEAPAPTTLVGPLTWPEVLERFLRPQLWLEHHPRSIHAAIRELVREELPTASDAGRARWAAALGEVPCSMRRYVVIRTDRNRRQFIQRELEAGRLRQGWGWRPEHDLRLLRDKVTARTKLTEEEAAVWRNRRLLNTEADGLKPDDVVIVPNIPEQGRWVLARVVGPYRFEPPVDSGVNDFGHVVPVEVIRALDGKMAVVEADSEYVDARLRASMRSMSRMWSVDALGTKVDELVMAIGRGADTTRAQPETERFAGLSSVVNDAAWNAIRERYKGAEFETLVLRVFRHIYDHGRTGRVEHWGGAGEKGADLIVFTQDPLGIEFKLAVQVKLHEGTHDDVHALEQIKWARAAHRVDAGVVLTTATELGEEFVKHHQALEAELGIDIRVLKRDEFLRLLLTHLGSFQAT